MKILIIGSLHRKNKKGIQMICEHLGLEYKFSNGIEKGFDLIYSPSRNIEGAHIYGPHFSVFPDNRSLSLKKGIYIQPSEWAVKPWDKLKIPVVPFPFPVETDRFNQDKNIEVRDKVILYYKHRDPVEFEYLKKFLESKNIDSIIFKYGSYDENVYLSSLKKAKYMIVLDGHESQGFAIEEALSCNVPLLVWNVKSMNQEFGQNFPDISATSIPYWDKRCGEFFYDKEELESSFNSFTEKLQEYSPRDYILENLSVEKCSERFLDLINNI